MQRGCSFPLYLGTLFTLFTLFVRFVRFALIQIGDSERLLGCYYWHWVRRRPFVAVVACH